MKTDDPCFRQVSHAPTLAPHLPSYVSHLRCLLSQLRHCLRPPGNRLNQGAAAVSLAGSLQYTMRGGNPGSTHTPSPLTRRSMFWQKLAAPPPQAISTCPPRTSAHSIWRELRWNLTGRHPQNGGVLVSPARSNLHCW